MIKMVITFSNKARVGGGGGAAWRDCVIAKSTGAPLITSIKIWETSLKLVDGWTDCILCENKTCCHNTDPASARILI